MEEILAEIPDPEDHSSTSLIASALLRSKFQLTCSELRSLTTQSEIEADVAAGVFYTWRVEDEVPIDICDFEIVAGMQAMAGRLALDASMTEQRVTQLLTSLPEGEFILQLVFATKEPAFPAALAQNASIPPAALSSAPDSSSSSSSTHSILCIINRRTYFILSRKHW